MAVLKIGEPPPAAAAGGVFLSLGFRPFYLLAALFACVAIPLWMLVLAGQIGLPLPGLLWHAHEMIFGFAVAVIVGFLYTAGKNWTGLQTPQGPALAGLALLWCAGRIALLTDGGMFAALIDFIFLPIAAVGLGRVLVKAGNRRNYVLLAILLALSLANLGFHLGRLGLLDIAPLTSLHFALGLIVMLETVMGGRVIPMFTENGIRLATGRPLILVQSAWIQHGAIGLTGLALLLWVGGAGAWAAPVSAAAAVFQLARLVSWKPWRTMRVPLVWILHGAYVWIPVGLLLLAAVQMEWLPRPAAVHAFGIGATGGLIIGMITRTALGHTGRPLRAGRAETTAYGLVLSAAAVRVLPLVGVPIPAIGALHLAAACWTAAFLIYLWRYFPILTQPRADGRPD
jgi:uncharacterized protein involved in response to NO